MSKEVEEYSKKIKSTWGSGDFSADKPNPFAALKDNTRRSIIVLLALNGPMTVKQLSEKLNLAPSTVLDHIRKLLEAGLVKEVEVPKKQHKREKYYGLDFVVYTEREEKELEEIVRKYADILKETARVVFEKALDELEPWFKNTLAAKHGFTLESGEIKNLVWVSLYHAVASYLSEKGVLVDPLKTPKKHYFYIKIESN